MKFKLSDFACGYLVVCMLAGIQSAQAARPSNLIEDQLNSFKVAPGFEVNLFASEKDGVAKPIQMRWDERGRLWVVCSTTYPMVKPGEVPNDRVVIVEDTDGDGRGDKTTVFVDGLNVPTGLEIAPGSGGNACYVGEGTTLWLMTDTNGDGRADRREVVLSGFGTGDTHHLINSFRWSPEGELVFCQGLNAFSRIETPLGISTLEQAGLWSYHPRTKRLDGFYGGKADPQNPWGWVYTRWGKPIVSAGNSGTMYYPGPEMIRGWQGGRRQPIWNQGRGRKTSGPEIIESAHFPAAWQGLMVPGGYIHNSVWTLVVEDDGSGLKLGDHPTLPPLIQSRLGSFRPLDVKLGPDGALYVLDWSNPIIGHYQVSMRHPDRDKTHGRIWRITAKDRPLLKPPQLVDVAPQKLFELLRSPDRWPREQAKRVLFGGDSRVVTAALHEWCERLSPDSQDLEFTLTQALGVFAAHDTVDAAVLKRVLSARAPEARAYAASMIGRWADRLPSEFDPFLQLAHLAEDTDAGVRLAVVVACGNIPRSESMAMILTVADKPLDPFIDTALRAAVATLKPYWEPVIARGATEWKPHWRDLLASLDRVTTPPPENKVAQQIGTPVVPIYGRLRATQFTNGTISAEVLTRGDAARGEEIYRRPELACVACHRIGDIGGNIGPALDAVGSAQPLEHLIGMVLEPQREVKEGFETIRIVTKKNEEFLGIVVAGNNSELTLRDLGGAEHSIAEADIVKREWVGSLMPAGLTDALSPEDLRDLFAYLEQLGKAK